MRTAFGILLFVLVYGPIAYMVYAEVGRQRSRVRPRPARSADLSVATGGLVAASQR